MSRPSCVALRCAALRCVALRVAAFVGGLLRGRGKEDNEKRKRTRKRDPRDNPREASSTSLRIWVLRGIPVSVRN